MTSEVSFSFISPRLFNYIGNKKFKIKPFDDRGSFPISVLRMPHLDSNNPSSSYYASIGSESLRFFKTTSDSKTFIRLLNQLFKNMQKQGNKHRLVKAILNKILGKYFNYFKV